MLPTSLSGFAEMMEKNRSEWAEKLPLTAQAAEAVNQAFQAMFLDVELLSDKHSGYALGMLSFGAYSSWVDAHLQSSAGQLPSAWGNLRRAIEFTCYSAKIRGSEKRAVDWQDQKDDPEAQRRFSLQCAVPLCYRRAKYKNLRRLIVAYDWANYYGAHGGFEALVGSHKEFSETGIEFTHPANKIEIILPVSFYTVMLGLEILLAFCSTFEPFLKNTDGFRKTLEFAQKSIKQAKEESYKAQFGGDIPENVKKVIEYGNQEVIDQMFEDLVQRELKRKGGKGGGSAG